MSEKTEPVSSEDVASGLASTARVAHTPGPWLALPVESDKEYIRIRGTRLGCRYKVANVLHVSSKPVFPGELEEARANAALIVSAPDLLEALTILYEETADYIRINKLGDVHHNRSMQLARAAIRKAEGAQ